MHPEAIKKISAELRDKIAAALAQSSLQATVAATRAASAADTGTFEVVISTNDVDRSGEIVDQNGWMLDHYKNNPVVLWGHDYYSLPIGVCDELTVRTVGTKSELVAKGRFAPMEANPFAQQVRALYDAGMMRTTSVGFIAHEMEGNVITSAELLEFSFVPVPANPMALSARQMKELNLDRDIMAVKGIKLEVKAEPAAGDTCSLEDGTDGVLEDQNGTLVCVPKTTAAAKAEGDVCTLEDGSDGIIDAQGECVRKTVKAEGDTCTLDDGSEGVMDASGTCVAKPASTEAAAKPASEKGAIADELDAEEQAELKWDQLDDFFDLVNAFLDVYLDENTPADQFPTLLTELADLIGQLAAGTLPDADEEGGATPTEASQNTGSITKARATAKEILSRASVEVMRTNTATQKDGVVPVIKREGVEREQTPSGEAAKQRSIHAGSEAAITALKAWNADRAALREIATLVGSALEASAKRYTDARKTK